MATIPALHSYWLESKNFAPQLHAEMSSKVGGMGRSVGVGYNSETLLIFDLSDYVERPAITSAEIVGTISGYDHSTTADWTAYLSIQNKQKIDWCSKPTPNYDDFASYVGEWDSSIQAAVVKPGGSGTVTFATCQTLVDEINNQIKGIATPIKTDPIYNRTYLDGIIVRMPTDFWGNYTEFSGWVLNINGGSTPTTSGILDQYYRRIRS